MVLLEGRSWVVAGPPKYAPATHTPVSLYQTFAETQKLDQYDSNKVKLFISAMIMIINNHNR